ncbi:hypothetical protein N7494_000497 [Penicillium frequentans]|uniref:Uncharacterized protein n=1 Tax=Penicillium frequentans TaxID=3151616 RepID=A0AAD6D628_9EURO|nr:hypothetical protein N7494_000497 [Penicillium glabrum]
MLTLVYTLLDGLSFGNRQSVLSPMIPTIKSKSIILKHNSVWRSNGFARSEKINIVQQTPFMGKDLRLRGLQTANVLLHPPYQGHRVEFCRRGDEATAPRTQNALLDLNAR